MGGKKILTGGSLGQTALEPAALIAAWLLPGLLDSNTISQYLNMHNTNLYSNV